MRPHRIPGYNIDPTNLTADEHQRTRARQTNSLQRAQLIHQYAHTLLLQRQADDHIDGGDGCWMSDEEIHARGFFDKHTNAWDPHPYDSISCEEIEAEAKRLSSALQKINAWGTADVLTEPRRDAAQAITRALESVSREEDIVTIADTTHAAWIAIDEACQVRREQLEEQLDKMPADPAEEVNQS